MTRAKRVDSTHLRLVVAQMVDERGSLGALLGHDVLRDVVKLEITDEAWTVDALACELLGTGFHALTFSLGPHPERGFPARSTMNYVPSEPQDSRPRTSKPRPPRFDALTREIFDTARRPTSVFDGTARSEFLIQFVEPGHDRRPPRALSFRDAIVEVAGLAVEHDRPLFFIHAPAATPSKAATPGGMTRQGLRFAVALPRYDDAGRLNFGTDLVDLCSRRGYGLWQRATSSGSHTHDYWDQVVPPRSLGDATATRPAKLPSHVLAVTCAGPARVGSTEALLDLLAQAKAPVLGLSALTLHDIAVIHLLTHIPRDKYVAPSPEVSADIAMSDILGLDPPARTEKLRDYRVVASPRVTRPSDPGLAALWLAWQAPATTDALRLTLDTLRNALDAAWARYRANTRSQAREGHLNIEYIACRNTTWADRLQGRMQVAIDIHAFSSAAPDTPDRTGPNGNGIVTASQLARFCVDVEHQWREALSLALGTPYVDVNVVWRESWLGHGPGPPTQIWAPQP